MKKTVKILFFLLVTGLLGLAADLPNKKESTMTKKLTTYRKKRQFSKTPEPVGSEKPAKKSNDGVFVIHKHDASHLHYDLRLEIDGVLKSWAVPKGPSTDPSVKRLAVETEDHPMEYLKFEGTIPQGQYGGGTVMVWDIGRFSNIREKKDKPVSLAQSYQDGTIEVTLHGKKLQGNYALVHTHFGKNDKNWLLIKMRDKFAEKKIKNVTKSAITGRTMKQIAQEE